MGILTSDIPISSGKVSFRIKCLKLGFISCGIGTKLNCAREQIRYFHGGHAGDSYYYRSHQHWEEGALNTFIGRGAKAHTNVRKDLSYFKEGEILTVTVDMEKKEISFSKGGEEMGSLEIPGNTTYYMAINLKPEDKSEWKILPAS